MSNEQITIINAALTRTGNNTITSLDDGSAEAEVANANYEEVVGEELDAYPWSFAKRDEIQLNRINEEPGNSWGYVYQAPADILEIVRVYQSGDAVAYERNGDRIYTDADDSSTAVYIEYTVRISEESWPRKFRAAIIERLEALFLRALNEDYDAAEAREQDAEIGLRKGKNRDSNNQTPRRRRRSRLTAFRRA